MGIHKRVYTVSYDVSSKSTARYGKANIPSLRFGGMWLKNIVGLNVGDKVQVLADMGQIAILKIEKGGSCVKDNAADSTVN